MTLLQFALNLFFGVVAYLLTTYLLSNLALNGVLNFLVAFLVGLGVIVANFAKKIKA